jgi:hypothetical protein
MAKGPPLLLNACPVYVTVVDVPAVLVTVRVIVNVPPEMYVWETVGELPVVVSPSPKSHWYFAMVPTGEKEPDPSSWTVNPLIVVVKMAVGAWSGVMPIPYGKEYVGVIVIFWVVRAIDRPLLLTAWPENTLTVDVPAVFVTVKETVYVPPLAYVWDVVGVCVITGGLPSPKSHL